MSEWSDSEHPEHLDEQELKALFDAPEPDEAFVAELERQVLARWDALDKQSSYIINIFDSAEEHGARGLKFTQEHSLSYHDFELLIERAEGSGYAVEVVRSPVGESSHREVMHVPFSEAERRDFVADLPYLLSRSAQSPGEQPLSGEQKVREFGRQLFDALFTGQIASLYRTSQAVLSQQGARMRLKLHLRPAELAPLPWEFLYDKELADYICLARQTSIMRCLKMNESIRPLEVDLPLRILALAASPRHFLQLDMDGEKRRLGESLADLQRRNLVQVEWLMDPTPRALREELRREAWHILYFVGHGGFDAKVNEGGIFLNDENHLPVRVGATELGRLLEDQSVLRLVMLNACRTAHSNEHDPFSAVATSLAQRSVPAVLAMQSWLSEPAAITFASEFFRMLTEGLPADAAVAEGRNAVALQSRSTLEWGVPSLYMRSHDGVLFHPRIESTHREDVLGQYNAERTVRAQGPLMSLA